MDSAPCARAAGHPTFANTGVEEPRVDLPEAAEEVAANDDRALSDAVFSLEGVERAVRDWVRVATVRERGGGCAGRRDASR